MCMKTSQDGFGSRILFRIEGRTTSGKDLSSPKKGVRKILTLWLCFVLSFLLIPFLLRLQSIIFALIPVSILLLLHFMKKDPETERTSILLHFTRRVRKLVSLS